MPLGPPAPAWTRLIGSTLAILGCGWDRADIIGPTPPEAPPPCPATLADRLTVTRVAVAQGVAWRKVGYDGFPADERIALATQPDGQAQIAWLEARADTAQDGVAPQSVHVTPLDRDLARRGDDIVIATGLEVAGLVAHNDGFAVLVRDANSGSVDLGYGNTVAVLVRHQNGRDRIAVPLTGALSGDSQETFTLASPLLAGQLAWNGSTYGAYFAVRGGAGDPRQGLWRDLLVYRDAFLRTAPWSPVQGCINNGGIRVIADPGRTAPSSGTQTRRPDITGLCVQQTPAAVKIADAEDAAPVSQNEVGWAGYAGARLGSLLRVDGGYLVFWLSLGATNDHTGHDIRMARLDRDFRVVAGYPIWLTRTPGIEEWNLHAVPYGPDRFLVLYNQIAIRTVVTPAYAVYLGDFEGTHLRLLDANGNFLSDEIVTGVPTTENDEPVVLPGGDVAWAFVNPAPDMTRASFAMSSSPTIKELGLARLRFCQSRERSP